MPNWCGIEIYIYNVIDPKSHGDAVQRECGNYIQRECGDYYIQCECGDYIYKYNVSVVTICTNTM